MDHTLPYPQPQPYSTLTLTTFTSTSTPTLPLPLPDLHPTPPHPTPPLPYRAEIQRRVRHANNLVRGHFQATHGAPVLALLLAIRGQQILVGVQGCGLRRVGVQGKGFSSGVHGQILVGVQGCGLQRV